MYNIFLDLSITAILYGIAVIVLFPLEKYLDDKSLNIEGAVAARTVSVELIDADETIGTYNAGIDIDYKVVYTTTCAGQPVSKHKTYHGGRFFNIND